MTMQDWAERLDVFLQFNERDVLEDFGRVSADVAKATAVTEYEQFDRERKNREAANADNDDIKAVDALFRELEHGEHH